MYTSVHGEFDYRPRQSRVYVNHKSNAAARITFGSSQTENANGTERWDQFLKLPQTTGLFFRARPRMGHVSNIQLEIYQGADGRSLFSMR